MNWKYFFAGLIIGIGSMALYSHNYFALKVQKTSATTTLIDITNPDAVSMLAVGDIMLGRHVEALMNANGPEYPFQNIDSLMKSTDAVVANLEGPILTDHVETPSYNFGFSFPKTTPELLLSHNVKIVNLANNHTYDFGSSGFEQTQEYLDHAGVLHAGDPVEFATTSSVRTTIKNKKFIFVGFNFTDPKFDRDAALNYLETLHKNSDETLIVMVHGGDEYSTHSNPAQENFYRSVIDHGADLVIGHHPHVVENIEEYKNKLIFYSLGNFIFDQYFSQDVQQELTVKITFNGDFTTYDLIPLTSVMSKPKIMNDADTQEFLGNLADRSSSNIAALIRTGQISN